MMGTQLKSVKQRYFAGLPRTNLSAGAAIPVKSAAIFVHFDFPFLG